MKKLLLSIIIGLSLVGNNTVRADDDDDDRKEHCHSHKCNDKCDKNKHDNDHKCNKYHCGDRCTVRVTNVVDVINTINLTNRYYLTNTIHLTDTITNYVTVTNSTHCPVNDLAISDYEVQKSHVYRLYVATNTRKWTHWATIRAGSNFTARLIIPLASVRPLYWQVVDFTPGYPRVAIEAKEPTSDNAVSYIALTRGRLYRIPDSARP
jgi:hypothetical protein